MPRIRQHIENFLSANGTVNGPIQVGAKADLPWVGSRVLFLESFDFFALTLEFYSDL